MDLLKGWSRLARVYEPLKVGSIDGTDTTPHDNGIVRAMQANYKCNKHIKGKPECTLFVGRLNASTSEEDVKSLFSRYIKVKRCHLVRDVVTGFSKCYAFVECHSVADAEKALSKTTRTILDDHEIFIDFELERTLPGWVPRRLGGGFGGKKESGQLRFGGQDRPFKRPIIIRPLKSDDQETKPRSHLEDQESFRKSENREDSRKSKSHKKREGDCDRRDSERYRSERKRKRRHRERSRGYSETDEDGRESQNKRHRKSRHHEDDSDNK